MESDFGREFVATKTGDPIVDKALDLHRPLSLKRPCTCGCDRRDGDRGVGYLTGGSGTQVVAIWLEHEEAYRALQSIFWARGLSAEV
jgi:hypothetical protein